MKKLVVSFSLFFCFSALAFTIDLSEGLFLPSLNGAAPALLPVEKLFTTVLDAKKGEEISFYTPEGLYSGTVILAYNDINGTETRAGNLKNQTGFFVLTISGDSLLGQVENTELNRNIKFTLERGEQKLSVNNLSRQEATKDFLPCGGTYPMPEQDGPQPETAAVTPCQAADASTASLNYIDWDDDEIVTLRLAVFYTPVSLAKLGGHTKMFNDIAQGIAIGNVALANSNAKTQIRIVHCQQWNYTEAGSAYTDLSRFYRAVDGFEGVWEVRNRVGANLCAIISREDDCGGLAYVNGSATGMPELSYHFIRDVQMVGTSWVHEMGHNMGCNHAHEQHSSPGPASGGVFGHSLGYYFIGATDRKKYATVMAYSQDGYERCDYFSNPDLQYKGTPCGTDTRNNALTWRKIRKIARIYRTLPKPTTMSLWSYEGFNYTPGETLDTKAGGSGWNSGWNVLAFDCDAISPESLYYSADGKVLATSKGSLLLNNPTNYYVTHTRMPEQIHQGINYANLGETSIWISLLAKPSLDKYCAFYFGIGGSYYGTRGTYWETSSGMRARDYLLEKGRTDLLLVRYQFLSNSTLRSTLWVNPKLDEAPEEDAYIATLTRTVYSSKDFTLSFSGDGTFTLDELRLGFSPEAVLPSRRPLFEVSQGTYSNKVEITFEPDTQADQYKIFRADTENVLDAELIGTVSNLTAYSDFTVSSGSNYYYWVSGVYDEDESPAVGPQRGYADSLILTADAGGPYVVAKGKDINFVASSNAKVPSYKWKSYNVETDASPFFQEFARTNNFVPGTYEVTVTVTDLTAPEAIPGVATTTLTVVNEPPDVELDQDVYNVPCGTKEVFHCKVKGAVPGDKFTYSWRPDDEAEFTDFSESSYFSFAYSDPNSVHTLTCRVVDNYSQTNSCQAVVNVGAAAPIMSAEPLILYFASNDCAFVKVTNLSAYDYNLLVTPGSKYTKVFPSSATCCTNTTVLSVELDREAILRDFGSGTFSDTIDLGFTNLIVKLSLPDARNLKINAGGPYMAYEGERLLLSADGTSTGVNGDFKYMWSVNGMDFSLPATENYLSFFEANWDPGVYPVQLTLYDLAENVLTNAETTLTVLNAAPRFQPSFISSSNLTVKILAYLRDYSGAEIFTRYDNRGWVEEGEMTLEFPLPGFYREKFVVRDITGMSNVYEVAFDLRPDRPKFTPSVNVFGYPEGDVEIDYGETLLLQGSGSSDKVAKEDLIYFWREFGGNPSRGVLQTPESAETNVSGLVPGEYLFALYVSDGAHLSLPKVQRVVVRGKEGLVYTLKDKKAYPLPDVEVTRDDVTTISDEYGRFFFKEAGQVTFTRCATSTNNLVVSSYTTFQPLLHKEPFVLLSGLVTTNYPWGSGAISNVLVKAKQGQMFSSCQSDEYGAFALFLPKAPEGYEKAEVTGTLSDYLITSLSVDAKSDAPQLDATAEESTANGYLYLTVIDDDANYCLDNAFIDVAGSTRVTNDKGSASVITLPRGIQTVFVSRPGFDSIVTNMPISAQTNMRYVRIKRTPGAQRDTLDLIVYDTDGTIVKDAPLRLVSTITASIIKNYTLPYGLFSETVLAGHKTTMRINKSGYENYNLSFFPNGADYLEPVLTPEPAIITLLALAAFVFTRRKK